MENELQRRGGRIVQSVPGLAAESRVSRAIRGGAALIAEFSEIFVEQR